MKLIINDFVVHFGSPEAILSTTVLQNVQFSIDFRYKREFGFTIPSRTIIVDDVRVRAVAVVIAHKQTPVPKASTPAEVETVSAILDCTVHCVVNSTVHSSLYVIFCAHVGVDISWSYTL